MDLLYPFYLDTDMSMAFSAVLAGGVALEEEHVGRSDEASQAVRSLRGNLRLWRAGGFDAGRERRESSELTSESRLVRRHTVASIFIDLYEELRTVDARDSVESPITRQQRRAQAREEAKRSPSGEDEGMRAVRQLRRLFTALRDDLDHSGMIDVAVSNDTGPNAALTLDTRFVASPTEELLHTSGFTVVGKVTQVWHDAEDIVNLYRRSVVSLLPSLAQSTAWGVFTLLASVASNLDVRGMERAAYEAAGATFAADEIPDPESEAEAPGSDPPQLQVDDGASDDADDDPPRTATRSCSAMTSQRSPPWCMDPLFRSCRWPSALDC